MLLHACSTGKLTRAANIDVQLVYEAIVFVSCSCSLHARDSISRFSVRFWDKSRGGRGFEVNGIGNRWFTRRDFSSLGGLRSVSCASRVVFSRSEDYQEFHEPRLRPLRGVHETIKGSRFWSAEFYSDLSCLQLDVIEWQWIWRDGILTRCQVIFDMIEIIFIV